MGIVGVVGWQGPSSHRRNAPHERPIDPPEVGTSAPMLLHTRIWPLLCMLACAYTPTRPSPTAGATRDPAATAPAPPIAALRPPPIDLCMEADETVNDYRDDDGCPDEQPIGMAYFANGLRPVSFTSKPLPGHGAPGVQSIFFSTPNDFASELYPHNRLGRFVATADAPRSTLAPRNDTSAYPLLRRFLARGDLPPIGVLRIESLIDYFTPTELSSWPRRGPTLDIHTEIGPCPWNPNNRLAHLRVQTHLPLLHGRLVIVILDVSHSMSTPERLPLLKQGLASLLDGLAATADNRVAVIGFANHEELVLPPTSLSDRPAIDAAIAGLRTRDFIFNRTRKSLASDLLRQRRPGEQGHIIFAGDGARSHGYPLDLPPAHRDLRVSVIGVGDRDFDDKGLGELATDHDGELYYLDTAAEARSTFTNLALWQGGPIVARDIQLQAVFDPATVARYHLVGHANHIISPDEFTRDRPARDVDGGPWLGRRRAGDLAAGQALNVLYELEPTTTPLAFRFTVRAHVDGRDRRITHFVRDTGADLDATSDGFRFTAAVAELGLLIQGGPRGDATLSQVRELATRALAANPNSKAQDFLALLDLVEAQFDDRAVQWAGADAWLRAHPPGALTPAVRDASAIPASSIPTLEFEAMRMRMFSTRYALVGVHDGREGNSSDERAAIARARAEAVKRYLVEVMGHPPEHYELRPMTADHVAFERIHNRRVQLEHILP